MQILPNLSGSGLKDYFIGDQNTSPVSELLSFLFFNEGKNSYYNVVLQYMLRYITKGEGEDKGTERE